MRTPLPLLALALAALALPAGVFAQDNPLGLTVSALEGPGGSRTTAEGINRGFGSLDCGTAGESLVRISPMAGTDITTDTVDVWAITDDTDCSTVESRNPDTGVCIHVDAFDVDPTDSSFEVGLSTLDTALGGDACGTTIRAGVTVRLFAFATGNVEDRGDVGSNWGRVSVLVDPLGPSAPTLDTTTASGDNEVSLGWERVSDDNATYRVYAGGACGGGGGSDGAVSDDGGTAGGLRLLKETSPGARSTTINPESIGLAVGESVEIYIIAVDEAGNEGEAAGPICVTRQQVVGFCDVFTAEGGECDPDGCAAGGPVEAPLAGLAFPLALGLVLRRRRR